MVPDPTCPVGVSVRGLFEGLPPSMPQKNSRRLGSIDRRLNASQRSTSTPYLLVFQEHGKRHQRTKQSDPKAHGAPG